MGKVDQILAVQGVETRSKWYQTIFHCRSIHGGIEFDVWVTANDEVSICILKWGEHDHPSTQNPRLQQEVD